MSFLGQNGIHHFIKNRQWIFPTSLELKCLAVRESTLFYGLHRYPISLIYDYMVQHQNLTVSQVTQIFKTYQNLLVLNDNYLFAKHSIKNLQQLLDGKFNGIFAVWFGELVKKFGRSIVMPISMDAEPEPPESGHFVRNRSRSQSGRVVVQSCAYIPRVEPEPESELIQFRGTGAGHNIPASVSYGHR